MPQTTLKTRTKTDHQAINRQKQTQKTNKRKTIPKITETKFSVTKWRPSDNTTPLTQPLSVQYWCCHYSTRGWHKNGVNNITNEVQQALSQHTNWTLTNRLSAQCGHCPKKKPAPRHHSEMRVIITHTHTHTCDTVRGFAQIFPNNQQNIYTLPYA